MFQVKGGVHAFSSNVINAHGWYTVLSNNISIFKNTYITDVENEKPLHNTGRIRLVEHNKMLHN